MENFYTILGVDTTATESEIKKKFRKLAKEYQPDNNAGNLKAAEKFTEINKAYDTLSDETRRKAYDATLHNQSTNQRKQHTQKNSGTYTPKVDFENIHENFENFFGFNPKNGNITNESKLKKNPLDTTDIFESFMKKR